MLLLIFALLFFFSFTKRIDMKTKLILTIGMLFVLTVVSFGLGTDYFSYEFYYNNFGASYNPTNIVDKGFTTITYFAKEMGLDYHVFASVIRIGILGITFKWISDSSDNIILSIALYFAMFYLVWTMSALRQGLVLSIGTYLFFNRKFSLNSTLKIILVLLLSLLHVSALYYLIFVVVEKLNFTKKSLIIMFIASVIISLVPMDIVLLRIPIIRNLPKLNSYISSSSEFFSFSTLMRLFYFITFISFYDFFLTDKYWKYVINAFLIGNILYFLLKFSEIVAGRFTIYTLILLVVLIPNLMMKSAKNITKNMYRILFSLVTAYSLLLFIKDVNAYRVQVGYKGDKSFFNLETVNNSVYDSFDNIYAFRTGSSKEAKAYHDSFKRDIPKIDTEKYSHNNVYISVYNPVESGYSILSNEGDFLDFQLQRENYSISSNILIEKTKGKYITNTQLVDLSGEVTDQKVLAGNIADAYSAELLAKQNEKIKEDVDVNQLLGNPTDFVPYPENIGKGTLISISNENIDYHVLKFKYYFYDLYVYLDENMVPYSNVVHTSYREHNKDGLLYATSYAGTIIYNSDGKIIWLS